MVADLSRVIELGLVSLRHRVPFAPRHVWCADLPFTVVVGRRFVVRYDPMSEEIMGFIFLCYFVNFVLVFKGKKKLAYLCFVLSTTLSLLMFWYHTTSSLDLNF